MLSQVLVRKQAGRVDAAQDALAGALENAFGLDLDTLRRLSRENLAAACSPSGSLVDGKAVAVADLLREDMGAAGRERARWLCRAALASGAAVPFDIYARIASL